MKIVSYSGEVPTALGAPDVAKLIELFKQQNEVLRMALTTVICVPAGTQLTDCTPAMPKP